MIITRLVLKMKYVVFIAIDFTDGILHIVTLGRVHFNYLKKELLFSHSIC